MKLRALVLCLALAGCIGSTKVEHGQRYTPEDTRYEPYFDNVHQQQVSQAGWADEKKAARKPLLDVLTLPPNATDDAIVNATRTRAKSNGGGGKLDLASAHVTPVGNGDPPLFSAVEESVRLELDRARKRRATTDKLEELAKKGEELKRMADREYENRGAEKADQKRTDQRLELRKELGASITVMRDMEKDASKDAQSGQDFLEDIGDAIEAKDAQPKKSPRESKPLPPPPPTVTASAAPPPPEKPEKPAKKKPAAKPAQTSAPTPPPDKPAPKPPPPPDDVFNP